MLSNGNANGVAKWSDNLSCILASRIASGNVGNFWVGRSKGRDACASRLPSLFRPRPPTASRENAGRLFLSFQPPATTTGAEERKT